MVLSYAFLLKVIQKQLLVENTENKQNKNLTLYEIIFFLPLCKVRAFVYNNAKIAQNKNFVYNMVENKMHLTNILPADKQFLFHKCNKQCHKPHQI